MRKSSQERHEQQKKGLEHSIAKKDEKSSVPPKAKSGHQNAEKPISDEDDTQAEQNKERMVFSWLNPFTCILTLLSICG